MVEIVVFHRNAVTLSALRGNDRHVTAFRIKTAQADALIHTIPFLLPDAWVGQGHLLTWKEMQELIKGKRTNAPQEEVEGLEQARDWLRDQLNDCSIDLASGAGGFLLVNGLPLANAQVSARLTIDLARLELADVPVLSATVKATGEVQLGAMKRSATFRIDVVVTRDAIVRALQNLSLDGLPNIPALSLDWPEIDWPSLKWPDLDLGGLKQLLRIDLPIPSLGGGKLRLRVAWDTPPRFTVTVDQQKRLAIAMADPVNGRIEAISAGSGVVKLADIEAFKLALSGAGDLAIDGKIKGSNAPEFDLPAWTLSQPEALPFLVETAAAKLAVTISGEIDLATTSAGVAIDATLALPRVLLRAKSDPKLILALSTKYRVHYDATSGKASGRLEELKIVEPYPIALLTMAAEEVADAAQNLFRLLAAIPLPETNANPEGLIRVIERILALLGAAVKWLAARVGEAVDTLLGMIEVAVEAIINALSYLIKTIRDLASGIKLPHLFIEVRLDSRSFALRQIVVTPGWQGTDNKFTGEALGLHLSLPFAWRPVLLVDFDEPLSAALLAIVPATTAATLSTDLWLANQKGVEAVRDTNRDGKRDVKRLVELTIKPQQEQAISLIRWSAGRARFFEALSPPLLQSTVEIAAGKQVTISRVSGQQQYQGIDWGKFDVTAEIQKDRLLPFLQSSEKADNSFLDSLGQYIEIVATGQTSWEGGKLKIPLLAKLKLGDTSVSLDLPLLFDLHRFTARFEGGDRVTIEGTTGTNNFNLLGLSGKILPNTDVAAGARFPFFVLDFSSGDARLKLAADTHIDLTYGKIASGGRGLLFRVNEFAFSRSGLDLDAKVDPATPVTLAGLNVPFRFTAGALSIKRSQIQAFAIHGAGQLPPALVGEANASIALAMGRNSRGDLVVQSAEAKLDKSDDPIVCHGTRFTLTLSAIGLEFKDFSGEGSGYHFYFTLTGSAQFTPRSGEFTSGLLKNFGSLTITLDKAPLTGDASMLARAIEFQVAVEPKKRINFFNLFKFELRGIGFHPASPAFSGKPAMSISGQVNFVEAGDIVSPRFDFHKLWIGPPKQGDWKPRVRFDGLTVGVRFGNAMSIEGTAIAVDDQLPSLYSPGALPEDVTTSGFLASGKLSIKGWASMSASMGFLELRKEGGRPRQAFFLYAQQNQLSIEIPTPVGPIYLREVGFGFGYRFTLAAFNRADQVKNVKELIQVLDDISRYQGDLASIRSWEPEAEGNRVTLALRGMISIASASSESEYNVDGEKDLANPVLFDVVAALRSDLTFFMNARVWLCFNYEDWNSASANEPWRTAPTLRGYTYLSVPRKEFLSRLISDGTGIVGEHPKLPDEIVKAMKGIRWSATTYIRPGLFHQEFGWPYELGFTFEKDKNLRIVCEGGLINRIEDGAMLFGIAFRAYGFAKIGGTAGGRSLGTSIVARADFALDAKFISYVSVTRFRDTLFYGALAFTATLKFAICFWLRVKAFGKTFSAELNFALSLTVSIGLETCVSPGGIGAKGAASIAVRGFGRTLRVAVGVSINDRSVREARARVARFLTLGLTVDTPDAEQGVTPPAVEAPRGPKSVAADQQVDEVLDENDAVRLPVGHVEPQGRALQPSAYWAMLFDVAGSGDRYVLVMVPRDHTDPGLGLNLPTHSSAGELLGTFYPPLTDKPLRMVCTRLLKPVTIGRLALGEAAVPTPALQDLPLDAGTKHDLRPREHWPVAREGDQELTLGAFLADCYIEHNGEFREPWSTAITARAERLPDSRESAAQILVDAGRDMLDLNVEYDRAHELEEKRSGAIASWCDSASSLASGGEAAWNTAPSVGFDVRALSVAFVVTGEDLEALFERVPDGGPAVARFDLIADGMEWNGEARNVHLFNPPERHFCVSAPRLAEPTLVPGASGIQLDWDLEPAFGDSNGVWNDPEFTLQHYRIERLVTEADDLNSLIAPRNVTTKSGAPLRMARNPESGAMEWRFLRAQAQFIDDLADFSVAARTAVLPGVAPVDVAPDSEQQQQSDRIMRVLNAKQPIVLRYVVVPVDIAGTDGAPTIMSVTLFKRQPSRKSVKRAVLAFEYQEIRKLGENAADATLHLGLDDGADPAPGTKSPADAAPPSREYIIRVRRERAVPSGLYGADAISDARARPSAADFAVRRSDDVDYRVKFIPGGDVKIPAFDSPVVVGATPGFSLERVDGKPNAMALFRNDVGISQSQGEREPFGVRFAIRPEVPTSEPTPWCVVDIVLRVGAAVEDEATKREDATGTAVEIFEHPVDLETAPLMFGDVDGEAGRVLVLYPSVEGSLAALLDGSLDPHKLPMLLADPARRVATRIKWNSYPVCKDEVAGKRSAEKLRDWFGGFDVCELDASADTEGTSSAPVIVALSYNFLRIGSRSDPGKRNLQLQSQTEQNAATAIFVDLTDADDKDRSHQLEAIIAEDHEIKGRLRLVSVKNPTKWLAFTLERRVSTVGYVTLFVTPCGSSGANPFAAGERVDLIYKGYFAARHVARVQALPSGLARLDPAEIVDFAKVEARYPSEAHRVSNAGSARRAPWYSPAESFVSWPEPTLRRSLMLNVDETIVTQLLSERRPHDFRITLVTNETLPDGLVKEKEIAGAIRKAGQGNLPPAEGVFEPEHGEKWTAAKLRHLLRDLVCVTSDDRVRDLRTATVRIQAREKQGNEIARAEWSFDFLLPLHPVLADVIDEIRYEQTPAPDSLRLRLANSEFTSAISDAEIGLSTRVDFDLVMPAIPGAVKPRIGLRRAREFLLQSGISIPSFSTDKAALVRNAVRSLATRSDAASHRIIVSFFERAPAALTGCQLEIAFRDHSALGDKIVRLPLDAQSLFLDVEPTVYRRYEPVLEPLPKTSASDVSGWLDETPTERDPYGWGVLRMLGLAMGLRLYDTELRQYVPPRDALRHVSKAFVKIQDRYGNLTIGSPFVDLITRSGGTMEVASFDGGAPGTDPEYMKRLLDDKALAMMQVALRPLAHPLREKQLDSPVGYFVIHKNEGALPIEINLREEEPNGPVIVIDLLDITRGFASAPIATLMPQAKFANGTSEEEKQKRTRLRSDFAGGASVRSTFTLDTSGMAESVPVALLRVIVSSGKVEEFDTYLQAGWLTQATKHSDESLRALGRFADLTAARFSALASEGSDDKDDLRMRGHESVRREVHDNLRTYCQRRWPVDGKKQDALIERLPEWTRRFIDHGPVERANRSLLYALAEVTRPDPWRVGVGTDRSMEILITHDDRKRRVKRYAVKPYGRYESFVQAFRTASAPAAESPATLTLVNWTDYVWKAEKDGVLDQDFNQRFVDIVIDRTEPLAPPVLVGAQRIQDGEDRRMLEFICARHPEEILSEANATVAGALSFEGIGVGLWREFPAERWVQDLHADVDTAEGFEGKQIPDPLPLDTKQALRGLIAGRFTDGWRGASVARTDSVPFFFRMHCVAFAAAGVVVSESVTATIPEGHYELHLPWERALFESVLRRPTWSLVRGQAGIAVIYCLPLVRYVDEMTELSRDTWLQKEHLQEVFRLPDPAVRYEIQHVRSDASGLAAVSTELEMVAQERPLNGPQIKSRYWAIASGPGYEFATPTEPQRDGADRSWFVGLVAQVKPSEARLPVESFAPVVEHLHSFELAATEFEDDAAWKTVMPQTGAILTLTPPVDSANGWAHFKIEVAQWGELYAPYKDQVACAEQIFDLLSDAANNASAQWWRDKGWVNGTLIPGVTDIGSFNAGLPRLQLQRPRSVAITTNDNTWVWPADASELGIDMRLRIAAIAPSELEPVFDFRDLVIDPIRGEMRRAQVARNEVNCTFIWGAAAQRRFAPQISAPIPAGLASAAIEMARKQRDDGTLLLPQCLDVLVAVRIHADAGQQDTLRRLLVAVESKVATFTAITSLGALEDEGTDVTAHLPVRVLDDAAVVDALQALGAEFSNDEPVIVVCRKPAEDEERNDIVAAIRATGDASLHAGLWTFVDRLTTSATFGAGCVPQVRVCRGSAAPRVSAIVAASQGVA